MGKTSPWSSKKGQPTIQVVRPDGQGGFRVAYFEDSLLKVPVPQWVDSRGYQEMPSSVALPMLLRPIQNPDFRGRAYENRRRHRLLLRMTLKRLVKTLEGAVSRMGLNEAVKATREASHFPPERLRAQALEQFAQLFPKPVAPQRWHLVEEEASRRAKQNERPLEAEMKEAVKAVAPLLRFESAPTRSYEASLRQALNELVTEYFLGPDWRARLRQEHQELKPTDSYIHNGFDLEASLIRNLANQSFLVELRELLSPKEGALLDQYLSDADYRGWAKRMWGWKDGTIDNSMARIREKGRRLASRRNGM